MKILKQARNRQLNAQRADWLHRHALVRMGNHIACTVKHEGIPMGVGFIASTFLNASSSDTSAASTTLAPSGRGAGSANVTTSLPLPAST